MPRATSLGEYALINSTGPRAEYVPTAELITPALAQTAIPASGNWTSDLLPADGYYDLSLAITVSHTGSLTVFRYLDDAGTIAIDAGQQVALTAAVMATLFVNDGKPFASFKIEVANTSGSAAAITAFAALMSAH